MKIDELVTQLRQVYGDTLRSVMLYGSAVAGEHIRKRSDYNILIVLESIPHDRMSAIGSVFRAWGDAGNPPPMVFTAAEWATSADVFPMEYADILESHRVLHGEDPTRGIVVSPSDLRLQLEQQALGKLLHLRRAAMAAGDDGKEQIRLLEASLSAIMVIFRAVVRLQGDVPSHDYAVLSADVASRAGFDVTPVQRVVDHVRGTAKIDKSEAGAVVAGYIAEMETLVSYLDRFTA